MIDRGSRNPPFDGCLVNVGMKNSFMKTFATQLGNPSGLVGLSVGQVLNRANSGPIRGTVDALGEIRDCRVADVGYGGGLSLKMLVSRTQPGGTVYGIDPSATAYASARRSFRREIENGRLRIAHSPMESLPLPDDYLDAVISANTLYYIEDVPAGLREVRRVLRPGGRAAIGVGDPDYMAKLPFGDVGVLRLRPVTEIVEYMQAAGLEVAEHLRIGTSGSAFHVLVGQ